MNEKKIIVMNTFIRKADGNVKTHRTFRLALVEGARRAVTSSEHQPGKHTAKSVPCVGRGRVAD